MKLNKIGAYLSKYMSTTFGKKVPDDYKVKLNEDGTLFMD